MRLKALNMPNPYVALAAVAALGATISFGGWLGYSYARNACEADKVAVMERMAQRAAELAVIDAKLAEENNLAKNKVISEFETLKGRYRAYVKDHADTCEFDGGWVRLYNAANRPSGAPEPDDRVPTATPP